MTKVGWLFEQEKQEAIAKVEQEKQQALAKAEEEKQQALARERQATKESVIKMIRKNYPTEDIAFIMSSFSHEDIEAIRRELAEMEY